MEVRELLRVVALRNGKLKPAEFRLREGETGLSNFACRDRPGPLEVLDAVRRAGKQGDLAAAVIRAEEIDRLGLVLKQTPGGTSSVEVNAIHYEARLRWARRLLLRLRRQRVHDYFHEQVCPKLWAAASVLD